MVALTASSPAVLLVACPPNVPQLNSAAPLGSRGCFLSDLALAGLGSISRVCFWAFKRGVSP
eukprot:14518592-Alexandrium_andersonii.AAC.1